MITNIQFLPYRYVHQPLFYNGDVELLSQQDSSHVEGKTGNGIKIYRPQDDTSDPGAFTVGGTNSKYELLDEEMLESKADHLQSNVDLEPATGLGVRSKLRFAVSHSIWECDPETNEHCKISRESDGSGKCYNTVGDGIFTNTEKATKKVLNDANKNNFTYPCSAANVMTPKVIGGKITPMYWYEDAREQISSEDLEDLTSLVNENFSLYTSFAWIWQLGFTIFLFGLDMMLKCFFFNGEKEWLKAGKVTGAANNDPAVSTVASTVEE